MVVSFYGLSLNALWPEGIDGGPNKNRISIAFSVERNSGMMAVIWPIAQARFIREFRSIPNAMDSYFHLRPSLIPR
jgi:hypothetical protein